MRTVTLAALLSLVLSAGRAHGDDRIDVGLLLGSTRATDEGTVLRFDRALTYQATLAWRIWRTDHAAVAIEVPFLASPAFSVATLGNSLPKEYASLYLTPGLRVTWPVRGAVSAFAAGGAGYARYSESRLRRDGGPNPNQEDTNTGALQFGGGLDVRGWFAARLPRRDPGPLHRRPPLLDSHTRRAGPQRRRLGRSCAALLSSSTADTFPNEDAAY